MTSPSAASWGQYSDLLAGRVRALRIQRGYTQSELAARSGVGKATVKAIERGEGNPRLRTLIRLMLTLEVGSLEELFGEMPTRRVYEVNRMGSPQV